MHSQSVVRPTRAPVARSGNGAELCARFTWRHAMPLVVGLLVLAAVVYPVWWQAAPLSVADSPTYQAVAQDLVAHGGLTQLHFRCPGYPLFLALTGASKGPTRVHFLVTLAMYLVSVWLLVLVARRVALPAWAGVVIAGLGVSPPFVEPSAYLMTEGMTAFLLVGALAFLVALPNERVSGSVAGLLLGCAALTRPTFQLLGVVLAVLLFAWREKTRAAWLLVVSSLVIGAFVMFNWVKFDYPGITPALGWNLTTRTARFVERLPDGPVKKLIVERRDRELVRGSSHSGITYVYGLEEDLAKATGLRGVALARYMLRLNVYLIHAAPLSYLAGVGDAVVAYWLPALGTINTPVSRKEQLGWGLLHFTWVALFIVQLVAVIGTVLTQGWRAVAPGVVRLYLLGVTIVFYTMVISCLADVGNARFRSPTDGIIVLVMVIGLCAWRTMRTACD